MDQQSAVHPKWTNLPEPGRDRTQQEPENDQARECRPLAPEFTMPDFMTWLREAIAKSELTEQEFLDRAGFWPEVLTDWTNGAIPSRVSGRKIAMTLGVAERAVHDMLDQARRERRRSRNLGEVATGYEIRQRAKVARKRKAVVARLMAGLKHFERGMNVALEFANDNPGVNSTSVKDEMFIAHAAYRGVIAIVEHELEEVDPDV